MKIILFGATGTMPMTQRTAALMRRRFFNAAARRCYSYRLSNCASSVDEMSETAQNVIDPWFQWSATYPFRANGRSIFAVESAGHVNTLMMCWRRW
jgi:hypothetical protein